MDNLIAYSLIALALLFVASVLALYFSFVHSAITRFINSEPDDQAELKQLLQETD